MSTDFGGPGGPGGPGGLDLLFGPDASPKGFTPAGIAAFDNLRPAAVVRELIQNSLDAAVEAGESKAIVRFALSTCDCDDIPGIEAYETAFEAAVDFHERRGDLPAKARQVVATMRRALSRDELEVLSVVDNGIGLDERRMSALLSDGVSAKGSGSSGTYGNGHSVAIPASDLRYALYGGLAADGGRVIAGHAVLATHDGEYSDFTSSGDGYLVRGFCRDADGGLFDFATANGAGDSMPGLVARRLDEIEREFGHGAAVVLPAFNRFRETRRPVGEMVLEAAACNFFVAIHEGRLEVQVEDPELGEGRKVLDSDTLAGTLARYKDQKRARGRAFLSGAKAYAAFRAVQHGRRQVIETSCGEVRVRLLPGAEITRIDLCRNGMWISDDKKIPGFYYKFADRLPFHAVLMLDSRSGGRLHELVRTAEGPLHDQIRLKDLSGMDKRDLRDALGEIREWILANTDKAGGDSFGLDDYLAIDFGENSDAGGASAPSYRGTPSVVRTRVPTWYSTTSGRVRRKPTGDGKGKPPNKGRKRRAHVLNDAFVAVSLPAGERRRRVTVKCHKDCEDAVLRLRVNENVDATCDSLWHEIVPVLVHGVRVNGQDVPDAELDPGDEDGEFVGVPLGALKEGATVVVETGYTVPDEFGSWNGGEPSLKVEIVERTEKAP